MLGQLLAELRNYFVKQIHKGKFEIVDHGLNLSFMLEGQYFRIKGSIFNDGVYQYPAINLKDEVFKGEIWALAIPQGVIDLDSDITAWVEKYGEASLSPYTSESFGGYSYSKSSGYASSAGTDTSSWKVMFKSRLNRWRKI